MLQEVGYGVYLFLEASTGLPYVSHSVDNAARISRHLSNGKYGTMLAQFKLDGVTIDEAEKFVYEMTVRTGRGAANVRVPPAPGPTLQMCR